MKMSREEIIYNRTIDEANYIIANSSTIRKTAVALKVTRSAVFRDLHVVLPRINAELSQKIDILMSYNKVNTAKVNRLPFTSIECECDICRYQKKSGERSCRVFKSLFPCPNDCQGCPPVKQCKSFKRRGNGIVNKKASPKNSSRQENK